MVFKVLKDERLVEEPCFDGSSSRRVHVYIYIIMYNIYNMYIYTYSIHIYTICMKEVPFSSSFLVF